MLSSSIKETTKACIRGCCPMPFLTLHAPLASGSVTSAASLRCDFEVAMASSICLNSKFTNHESLPSFCESFTNFVKTFPQYSETIQADRIRQQEYYHLSVSNRVCLDYIGHGLFSYAQQQNRYHQASIASTSTASPPIQQQSTGFEAHFFDISYKSVNLKSQVQYGGEESELENKIKNRIMAFMNISEEDYTLVFTANQTSAFKLVGDAYPFQSDKNLLTVYDYDSEAVKMMIGSSKKKGARIMSAEFTWPTLRIQSEMLLKKVVSKCKKRKGGLFVFPLESRTTGARYSYIWMNIAQENGWHVLLDACALGAKEMETLGLFLFKPDFLICSFFKIFGENPSGFGCLFVKKSSASVLNSATVAGIVRLVPAIRPFSDVENQQEAQHDIHNHSIAQGTPSSKLQKPEEIAEQQKLGEIEETSTSTSTEVESNQPEIMESRIIDCTGLDHADSLGLIVISARARYLTNWLVNALLSLQHPNSENGVPPIRIYGPKVRFDRGAAVAFNVFDWKGEKIDPALVQKLADRNNISLSYGILQNVWFSNRNEAEKEWMLETRGKERSEKSHSGISVVTAALGWLTNFEDVYRVWAFVSRFLDADFVEKERWRYTALNQKTIEI